MWIITSYPWSPCHSAFQRLLSHLTVSHYPFAVKYSSYSQSTLGVFRQKLSSLIMSFILLIVSNLVAQYFHISDSLKCYLYSSTNSCNFLYLAYLKNRLYWNIKQWGKNVGEKMLEKNNIMSLTLESVLESKSGLSCLTILPSVMPIKIMRYKFLKTKILIKRLPNSGEGLVRLDLSGVQIHTLQLLSLSNWSQCLQFVHSHRYTADTPTAIHSWYYCV